MNWYYIRNTIRRICRHKAISAINIFGLAVAIASCIFIYLFVYDELQYDKGFPNSDRLYRVYGNNFGKGTEWFANQPNKLYTSAVGEIPEIEAGTVFEPWRHTITFNNTLSSEKCAYTDSSIFEITGWKMLLGDPHQVLAHAMTVVISESASKKIFGAKKNPIGELIDFGDNSFLIVTGVFKDISKYTHIQADFLTSMATRDSLHSGDNHWGNFSTSIFLRLRPNVSPEIVGAKLTANWIKNANQAQFKEPGKTIIKLQPIKDVYLRSSFISHDNGALRGNYATVAGLSVIAVLILLIACFNYLNLTTAQANDRSVEVGIRKTSGVKKTELYKQFIIESAVFGVIALIVGIAIVNILLPWFNSFTAKETSLSGTPSILLFTVTIMIFIVMGAGLYPAFILSNYKTAVALKGKSNVFAGRKSRVRSFHQGFSQSLIVIQLSISVVLIICALFINKQISFIRHFDAGFNKEQIMVIYNSNDGKGTQRYEYIKQYCAQMPEVEMVTAGMNVPTDGFNNYGSPYYTTLPNPNTSVGYIPVDYDYLTCVGARFIKGRNFNKELASDAQSVIISENCMKELGDDNPIGKQVDNLWDGEKRTVIGVVKDIHFTNLHNANYPVLFILKHNWMPNCNKILVKFKTKNYGKVRDNLADEWKKLCPTELFSYFFLDDKFEDNYRKDSRVASLMNAFTLLSILLCMLGLAGLIMFATQKRSKEIGIRKINGAKIWEVMALLNQDFIKWGAIAFLIACPAAWYAMNKWLENFAYKTELNWWVFATAGMAALTVALVTVSWQSWRAARRNPVESLRYE